MPYLYAVPTRSLRSSRHTKSLRYGCKCPEMALAICLDCFYTSFCWDATAGKPAEVQVGAPLKSDEMER